MPSQTPSQTVGPYFSMRLGTPGGEVLVDADTPGERIVVEGTVLDGDRHPVEDALVEIWQADAAGHYRHPGDPAGTDGSRFTGFGRVGTDFATGAFRFETIKPGRVPDPEGELQAPHLVMTVQARGMLRPSFTRVYFEDEPEANADDLVLGMVPEDRRGTLLARVLDAAVPKPYRFDIRFQGSDETVFFDF